jgi:hypothetical protein
MNSKIFTLALALICCNLLQGQGEVQPFLPDLFIQYPNVRDFTTTVQEDEAYFTMQSVISEISIITMIKKENGSWLKPEIAAFSGDYTDLEPFLSPNELRLYFVSNRPTDDSKKLKDFDIWYVERSAKNAAWSSPINIGSTVNSEGDEYYPSVSKSKNLYFTRTNSNSESKDDIFVSIWNGNSYNEPTVLGDAINTNGYEFNSFISPGEDFLIFGGYQREDGFGGGDMYISFKDENNQWTAAKNLGTPVNSNRIDYCPYVNMSTQTLYFTSKRSAVNKKKSKYFNFDTLLNDINQFENGSSRIYKANIEHLIKKY